MPRLPFDFSETEPAAIGDYTIDFGPEVPDGATIDSVVWALGIFGVLSGATRDPSPNSHLTGNPVIVGTKTAQRISHCDDGNIYLVVANALLSDGELRVLWTILPCYAPGTVL